MTPTVYTDWACRSKGDCFDPNCLPADVIHAAIGINTEAGEILDVVKRGMFYGKPITDEQRANIIEEFGDLLWYIAIGCRAMGISMEQVMSKNIAKLLVRYPERFDPKNAADRNITAELKAMEIA